MTHDSSPMPLGSCSRKESWGRGGGAGGPPLFIPVLAFHILPCPFSNRGGDRSSGNSALVHLKIQSAKLGTSQRPTIRSLYCAVRRRLEIRLERSPILNWERSELSNFRNLFDFPTCVGCSNTLIGCTSRRVTKRIARSAKINDCLSCPIVER